METKKILLVDDQVEIIELIEAVISSRCKGEFEINSFTNPVEAYDESLKTDYNILIVDQDMPIMSGIEMIKRIRKFNEKIKIILLSVDSLDMKKTKDYTAYYIDKTNIVAPLISLINLL